MPPPEEHDMIEYMIYPCIFRCFTRCSYVIGEIKYFARVCLFACLAFLFFGLGELGGDGWGTLGTGLLLIRSSMVGISLFIFNRSVTRMFSDASNRLLSMVDTHS